MINIYTYNNLRYYMKYYIQEAYQENKNSISLNTLEEQTMQDVIKGSLIFFLYLPTVWALPVCDIPQCGAPSICSFFYLYQIESIGKNITTVAHSTLHKLFSFTEFTR